ncbi:MULTISPECIES: hypothetical protein [unclassified Streptomyces]|uniref:hypothetical protein n=1 Tax=unclassified Streptomyces TaxID=2593676 RepID=UPI0029ABD103|nr:hypothetical protein [Streptomyces sp. DK15]MDX2395670.1 hypothetical protein [Streptomyces sp. DK15]
MGAGEHIRGGDRGRPPVRRAAVLLLIAFGVAAGVAFLCVRPADAHVPDPVRAQSAHAVCVSPYDLPGCSPLSHVTPAVPPAPPPAAALAGAGSDVAPRTAPAGPVRPPGTLARAPDLHALQVLRT